MSEETKPIGITTSLGGRKPKPLPGEDGGAKLPPPTLPSDKLPDELREAWLHYMVNGFKHNEVMFNRTLDAFMKPYKYTIWMYWIIFAVGIGLFLAAVVIGLRDGQSPVAIVFAGLGAGGFVMFFIRQPVQALEENLEFITWLGVAFNTYWTRLMYMMNTATIQQDLKAAEQDFIHSVERLITQHADLRAKRPGTDLSSGGKQENPATDSAGKKQEKTTVNNSGEKETRPASTAGDTESEEK